MSKEKPVTLLSLLQAEPRYPAYHYPGHQFDRTPLGDFVDIAAMRLLKAAFDSVDDKNLVTSPVGVFTLLSMYATGAGPESLQEMVAALGVENELQLLQCYNGLGEIYTNMDRSFLILANRIYISNQLDLTESFLTRSTQGSVERVDFQDPQAGEIINQWAQHEVNGCLTNPIPAGFFSPDAMVALLNVISFKGHWGVPFSPQETKFEDFYINRSVTVKKPMMRLVRTLFYHESKDFKAKFIEIPYQEKGFRMVLVIPDEIDGLLPMIEKATHTGLLIEVFKLLPAGITFDLLLPKFTMESGLDLNSLLPQIGISKIFSEGAPNLVKETAVVVSRAIQKALIQVDEDGASSIAFTGVIPYPRVAQSLTTPPTPIRADHPFIYLILHEDKILFVGTYCY